jgi:hypothetical protein
MVDFHLRGNDSNGDAIEPASPLPRKPLRLFAAGQVFTDRGNDRG